MRWDCGLFSENRDFYEEEEEEEEEEEGKELVSSLILASLQSHKVIQGRRGGRGRGEENDNERVWYKGGKYT